MVKITAVSDLHGYLPEIPECDLFIVAGDILWHRSIADEIGFLQNKFKPWLEKIKQRNIHVIGCAGNHDHVFEQYPEIVKQLELPWEYLQDEGTTFRSLKIWGSPWSVRFGSWSFMMDDNSLKYLYDQIPRNIDILITHGPPSGYGDSVYQYGQTRHIGSPSLTKFIFDQSITTTICGHCHEGYGKYEMMNGKSVVYNCSLLNEMYVAANPIMEIEI